MLQQNHLAELGFAVLTNRGRALMTRVNIPVYLHYKLFKEAFKTATLLDALLIVEIDGERSHEWNTGVDKNLSMCLICAHGVKQVQLKSRPK